MRGRTDTRSIIAAGLIALIAVAWLPIAHASGRRSVGESQRSPILLWSTLPIQTDLDGDLAIDSMKLSSFGFDKTIDIKFGNLRTSAFNFAANTSDPGTLIARDIDGDGDVDLIWVANHEQKSAVVLINDGKGDFTRAKDNAPYASELKALLNSSDPTDQSYLQAVYQTFSLTSSSFPDIGPIANSWLLCPTTQSVSFVGTSGFTNRAAFLSYLHKRGPPLIIS